MRRTLGGADRAAQMRRTRSGAAAALVALLAAALVLLGAPAAAPAQTVSAKSGILVEPSSGDVLWSRAPNRRRAIASTTKLMTALLVLERSKLSDLVPAAPYRALPVESKINLRPGERLTTADLLRGLLVFSANDAAATLATHVAGSTPAFVRLMNRRARELKLTGTHYANPVGLDDAGNYSTARDLVTLTERLWRYPFFRRTVKREKVTLESGDHPRTLTNRNDLIGRFDWVNGVKTGHTQQAGWVLVGAGRRKGVQLFSAVLGAPSAAARDADTLNLLREGYTHYKRVTAVERGDVEPVTVPIRWRRGAVLKLMAGRTVSRVLRDTKGNPFTTRPLQVPREVEGPIRRGQPLGTLEVRAGGRRVAVVPLVAANEVPKAGFGQQTKEWFTHPAAILLAAAAILVSVLLARRGAEVHRRRRRPREEPETA
jgi:D-alanyl-D-alanine carboxypeptidase (penicillin-binding protein 5/6)